MTDRSLWRLESHPGLYEQIGERYAIYRRPDSRIAEQILRALGGAKAICNVGAGSGSYEPERGVVAVEPSERMIAQRTRTVVRGVAEALPFRDDAFEAVMAVLTIHHWQDVDRGLEEMRRVAPRRVVLAFDETLHYRYWLVEEYLPEIATLERMVPSIDRIARGLEAVRVEVIEVPFDCSDGFLAAYWRRPERYLESEVRACISPLAQLDQRIVERGMRKLRADLASGAWAQRHADLLGRQTIDAGYRLLVCE